MTMNSDEEHELRHRPMHLAWALPPLNEQPAAGWYPAPDGAPLQVWWDGQQWTDHTAPAPSWVQMQTLAATEQTAASTRRIRGMIAGLIFGVGLILLGLHMAGKF